MENDVILNVKDLTVHFEMEEETVKAVNGFDLQLRKGKTIALVG